jgi:hypothetical protein
MGRIWALAGALVVVYLFFLLIGDFLGAGGMLTMGLCAGAGAAAAYLSGTPGLARAIWLFLGVLIGALGFLLGAGVFPDTNFGLFLGAVVPTLIAALATMWQKRVDLFLAAIIGSGAISGVYANVFNADPQSVNVSLVVALGQTILPLGFGYLAGILVRTFVGGAAEDEAATDGANLQEAVR